MRYESKINFARRAGVSRQAIYQLIRDGKLIQTGAGKLDVHNPLNKEYLSMKKDGKPAALKKPKSPTKKQSKRTKSPKNDNKDVNLSELDMSKHDLDTISAASLNRLKTASQIRSSQVKTDEARRLLLSRKTIQAVFSKLYIIDVNQWRTLGPNLSPEIAAIVGIDDEETILKISKEIDSEVFKILKQVKRLINDFLKDQKASEIK